ncbi:MAG: hypothetical protein GY737_07725, partial [Desulfobacteraceae bacterium]|nr:hypothetical protein [Desulfobacteraceae bacterium]
NENINMCLPCALIIGMTFASQGQQETQQLCHARGRLRRLATDLCQEAGLTPTIAMGQQEIEAFAQTVTLQKYRIIAYTERGNKFHGTGKEGRHDGHIFIAICCQHFFMVRDIRMYV